MGAAIPIMRWLYLELDLLAPVADFNSLQQLPSFGGLRTCDSEGSFVTEAVIA